MGHSLEVFSNEIATAVGPSPREGVVIKHSRHDVVNTRRFHELLALEIVVMGHIQSKERKEIFKSYVKECCAVCRVRVRLPETN